MLNRFTWAMLNLARQKVNRSTAWAAFARDTINGFITTAHHTVMILGVSAICALALMFVKPDMADQLKALSPFTTVSSADPGFTAPPLTNLMDVPGAPISRLPSADMSKLNVIDNIPANTTHQQQSVTNWLSKRYRVAGDATNMLVSAAYLTAREIQLDPLLILAVMAIESGLNPFAESAVGAQGLMQVMSKIHHEKFQELGGIKAALNPVANIKVGSLILKDYVTRGGSVEAGLKLYVGAAAFDSDFGYGSRVLAEYRRLKEVANGKSVPIFTAPVNPMTQKPAQLDQIERKSITPIEAEAAASSHKELLNLKANQVAAL
jgi:hypothetical protein